MMKAITRRQFLSALPQSYAQITRNTGAIVKVLPSTQHLFNQVPSRSIISFNKFRQLYQDFWKPPPPKAPYSHICQIGDPVLRGKADSVKSEDIKSPQIQELITKMKKSMTGYKAVGLSAPQLGVPVRIIALHFSKDMMKIFDERTIKLREMETFPMKIVINPVMKMTGTQKIKFPEACESIKGYSASVARYHSVKLTGLDENGEPMEWHAKGWSARIIQHEMDHLDGRLYTDIMEKDSFSFGYWYNVNVRSGRFNLSYSPYKLFS